MRHLLLALPLLLGLAAPATARLSLGIGIDLPGLSIGIDMPAYPRLQRVPGYPVYYAPQADANYFFYDGVYWVYREDDWYASSWYDGPWRRIARDAVPVLVLRVPVRYYRQPPEHFRGWRPEAPPHWAERWGRDWQRGRPDWNPKTRHPAPAAAPLPAYQQQYPRSRYPDGAAQRDIVRDHYRYAAREPVVRQQFLPHPDPRSREAPRVEARPEGHDGPGRRDKGEKAEKADKRDKGDKSDRGHKGEREQGPRH